MFLLHNSQELEVKGKQGGLRKIQRCITDRGPGDTYALNDLPS